MQGFQSVTHVQKGKDGARPRWRCAPFSNYISKKKTCDKQRRFDPVIK